MDELRCESVLHGVLVSPGVVEFKCRSRFCGAKSGVVVLHRFDAMTGELLETKRFQEPSGKEQKNAASHSASVWHS